MSTASTILDYAQNQLGFNRSDIGIPGLEETQLLAICNQAVIEYYEAHRKGGGEPPIMFIKETGAELTADTVTGEAVTSATTDFDVTSSSDFPTSGVLALWDNDEPDYVAFTGNAANNFTGVTGIGYNHASGVTCSRLYALPPDFNDFRSEPDNPDGTRVDGTPYTQFSGTPRGLHFRQYSDGTTNYMHFPQGLTGSWSTKYNAKPTTVSASGSTVDIPTKDEWFAVWRIIQHVAPILGKLDMYQIAANRAQEILRNALITRSIGKKFKVRPLQRMTYKSSSNPLYR